MKTNTQKTSETIKEKGKQRDALSYAIYLLQKKHSEAVSMVENVPNNIYIEEWKRQAETTGEQLESLEQLKSDLESQIDALCRKCDNDIEQEQKAIRELMSNELSSAYQEQAIEEAQDDLFGFEMENAQEFADACCEYYRDILKGAGFGDDFGSHSIYKGFAKYGDECQVQMVAFKVWEILTK